MDSNKFSTQVERLGVVETGRRRRWADDGKLKIVAESMETARAISSTARRYGISRSPLLNWRRSLRIEPDGAAGQKFGFAQAMIAEGLTAQSMSNLAELRTLDVRELQAPFRQGLQDSVFSNQILH
jgi:transposase-like protein